jgi:hypothetical protein
MAMADVTYTIQDASGLQHGIQWAADMATRGIAGGPVVITMGRPGRGSVANAKFHAMIGDIQRQCFRGHSAKGVKAVLVNQFALEMAEIGEPLRHPGETAWDWKHQQAVYVRPSTTDFTKAEAGKFIEWLYATGAELNVEWSEPALDEYQKWLDQCRKSAT